MNDNGHRDEHGRFVKGCAPGPGNPHVKKTSRWRAALTAAVSEADIRAVTKELVSRARAGERWAIVELLDRTVGREPIEVMERIEFLEELLG